MNEIARDNRLDYGSLEEGKVLRKLPFPHFGSEPASQNVWQALSDRRRALGRPSRLKFPKVLVAHHTEQESFCYQISLKGHEEEKPQLIQSNLKFLKIFNRQRPSHQNSQRSARSTL